MVKLSYNNQKFYMEDGENKVELTKIIIDPKTKKEKLVLPENSSNRKYQDVEALKKSVTLNLEYKESRTLGTGKSYNTKKLYDYLSEEEQQVIKDLMEKAKTIKEEQKKVAQSPLEKAKKQYEKYKALVEKLSNKE